MMYPWRGPEVLGALDAFAERAARTFPVTPTADLPECCADSDTLARITDPHAMRTPR
jgi:hypothetical protein